MNIFVIRTRDAKAETVEAVLFIWKRKQRRNRQKIYCFQLNEPVIKTNRKGFFLFSIFFKPVSIFF